MIRYKFLNYNVAYLPDSAFIRSTVLYEYKLPTIVMDEKSLAELAEKKNFKILHQIREGYSPPVVRIMRAVYPFSSFKAIEEFLRSMHKSTTSLGVNSKVHVALILPSTEFIPDVIVNGLFSGLSSVTVTVDYKRTPESTLSVEDILPPYKSFTRAPGHLITYRDLDDPEDIWKLKLVLKRPGDAQATSASIDQFKKNAKKFLDIKSGFQYRYVI